MSEGRGVVNEVPHRLRGFAKGQRSDMPPGRGAVLEPGEGGAVHGYKFKRQVPLAPYIVDFMCASERLIVELDGPPHEGVEARANDAERDARLVAQGFKVLRFSNDEVLGGCDLVLQRVLAALAVPSPAPLRGPPSPAKGERVRGARVTLSPLAGEGGRASGRERGR